MTLQRKTPLARGSSQLKRTPLKRGASQLKRTRLAPVSAQRKAENADEWPALKALVWARDGGRCRAAEVWPEVECGGRVDVHHREPTGLGYPRLCPVELLVCCCRNHHDQIHQVDPIGARVRGLLR